MKNSASILLATVIALILCFQKTHAQIGAVDLTFNPSDAGFGLGEGANGIINASIVQSDGKILIAGDFTAYNGTAVNRLARLNTDGTLDATFNSGGSGANAIIYALALQSDGKIIIGGNLSLYNGTIRERIARVNTNGTLDATFNPGAGASQPVRSIAIQSDGKIVIGGQFTVYDGTTRNYVARINSNGTLDGTFDPGSAANNFVFAVAIQTDDKILIGGSFTARIARLDMSGGLDGTFDLSSGGPNSTVNAMSIQSDGKIVIGGAFTTYDFISRNRIARVNANGSLDGTFDPGTGAGATVEALKIQTDDKIVIGGQFTTVNGTGRNRIARLSSTGTLDGGFDPGTGADAIVSTLQIQSDGKIFIGGSFNKVNNVNAFRRTRLNTDGTLDVTYLQDVQTGANGIVNVTLTQADGKILAGGDFTFYNGTVLNKLVRTNTNGSIDGTFNMGTGIVGTTVSSLVIQPDNKIVIGGAFSSYNGTSRNNIVRVDGNGTLDALFDPGTGANGQVFAMGRQSDGKILLGGIFTTYNGTSRNRIVRINTDGSLDGTFDPGTGANSNILALIVQSDDKVIVGGTFTSINGTPISRIARLNTNGSLDLSFDPGAGINSNVTAIGLQSDGKIIVGGLFTLVNSESWNRIVRLNTDGSIDGTFNIGSGADNAVSTISVHSDNRLSIGGAFTSFNGSSRNRLARLNANGSLDTGFGVGTGFDNAVQGSSIQPDGNLVIGGNFNSYNGTGRNRLARIFAASIPPTVTTSDSLALVSLYNSTNGAGWTNNTNWLTGPVNTWFGVTVGGNRVTGLNLNTNLLSGPIPIELGNLTNLTLLILNSNQLSGPIPTQVGNLINLTNLNLFSNRLTGLIPSQIGNLTGLTSLNLSTQTPGPALSGPIPIEIGNLVNLTSLNLNNNLISGLIPSQIGNLVNLTSLRLAGNILSGSGPTQIANLTNLVTLSLNFNNLTDLPDLSSLTNLIAPDISNNFLTFKDIVPNAGIPGIIYSPQKSIGLNGPPIALRLGETLNITQTVQSFPGNLLQWVNNGTPVAGQNGLTIVLPNVTTTDEGQYQLSATNPGAPGLTVFFNSRIVTIILESVFEWANGGELTQDGFDPTRELQARYGGQWGDFNNDGYEDVFMVGTLTKDRSILYKNNRNGTFSRIPFGSYFFTDGRSVAWADYNNDGLLDCFAPAYAPAVPDSVLLSSIFKNNGDETFSRITLPYISSAGTWLDADLDGDLDIVFNNNSATGIKFLRNDGNDTFVELSPFTGTPYDQWNPVAIDINNDGLMDLYIPGDQTAVRQTIYYGAGNNTFSKDLTSILANDVMTSPRSVSWADIDNDGDLDALVPNNIEDRFYINDGTGTFSMQLSTAVLGEPASGGRGSAFGDFNNDGYNDLLLYSNQAPIGWKIYLNNKNGTFTRVTSQSFTKGVGLVGASFGDYDNDGFIDIVTGSYGDDFHGLFRNKGNGNSWLQLKLVGNISNKSAIGARVAVYSPGNLRTHQQILTANGGHNQNSLIAQFGLGSNTAIDSVIINWPSGLRQKVTGLAINRRWSIKENNFEIDSLALVAFYNATGGPSWTNKTNWLTGPVTTWVGVTFTGGNVTAINLPNNKITGSVPEAFANLIKITSINLSGNSITSIPDLTSLPALLTVNVSDNKLDFASLERNGSLTSINYGNQAVLGDSTLILVDVGTDYTVATNGGGISDQYQWKRNDVNVSGANQKTYVIAAINRSNMGDYRCEISNPNVPGLVLNSAEQRIRATANISGRLLVSTTIPASAGEMTLFKIKTGAYDTTAVKTISANGTYSIEKVILDDYQLLGFADTLLHVNVLPTYFTRTIYWEEADVLAVEGNLVGLDITSIFKPAPPKNGAGMISGIFSEGEDESGGKVLRNARIRNAGASLRRVERTSRGKEVILTLVAYTFTNEEGEFTFNNLDPGEYRFNLQYPGYPMDENSFIDIVIGTGLFERQVSLDARVVDGKIFVRKRVITGWESRTLYAAYPNPTKDLIRLQSKSGSSQRILIEVMDNTGKKLNLPITYDDQEDSWLIDVSSLPFGSYFLNAHENNGHHVLRVIVAK